MKCLSGKKDADPSAASDRTQKTPRALPIIPYNTPRFKFRLVVIPCYRKLTWDPPYVQSPAFVQIIRLNQVSRDRRHILYLV
jgi:hypothetical protein